MHFSEKLGKEGKKDKNKKPSKRLEIRTRDSDDQGSELAAKIVRASIL
jgi:hypothetical protein